MSQVTELIAECKEHLSALEQHASERLHAADPTQLRIAAQRLGLFADVVQASAEAVPVPEPEPEPVPQPEPAAENLSALTRPDLDAHAAQAGVEAPEKLPNKDAVIAAIAEQAPPEPTEAPVQ